MHPLFTTWRNFDISKGPLLLSADSGALKPDKFAYHTSYSEYVKNQAFGNEKTKLHIGLLPVPFMGNVEKADIILFMLNPGISHSDYYAEMCVPKLREFLVRNLRQKLQNQRFPFICLDPEFAGHPGFGYWYKRLLEITSHLEKSRKITHQEALSLVASRVACLQLVPYHSEQSTQLDPNKLESSRLAINYARTELSNRAKAGNALLIVLRGSKHWGLQSHKNIIEYGPSKARSAVYLTLASPGGEAIIKRLNETDAP